MPLPVLKKDAAMTYRLKKLGATLTVLATVCFNPIPAIAQETDLQPSEEAIASNISELRAPGERDIYDVDTSDWDFNEPGMNKNNIDNHYYEQLLPTDLGEPQPDIIDGAMRSDRIDLPDTVTKQEADKAEVLEAKQRGITKPGDEPLMQPMAAENCRTYWPSSHQVCGAIREKYESMAVTWAGQTPISFLGLPKSGELTNPDGVGKRTEFDNGFIYWHPDTGAWSVTTHNSIVWARNGWEQGRLGYPTSDEIGTGDNVGRKQSFQRGRIYGSLSGVVSIEGKILEKWIETGEEKGPLGYPATDEEGTPDGVGRFNRFALGMIYWHPQHGAHPVTGAISAVWSHQGFERSEYGYPTSDAITNSEGDISQAFEKSTINLGEIFRNSGSITINGKEIDQGLYEFAKVVLGVDLANNIHENDPSSPVNTALQATSQSRSYFPPQNAEYHRTIPSGNYRMVSPITIPINYSYNLADPRRKLHDFCSRGVDFFSEEPELAIVNVADFRGPCATHDQCYESFPDKDFRVRNCDPLLRQQLNYACNQTSARTDGIFRRPRACTGLAEAYYQVAKELS
ncbi:LGFP repeat-containing protein [Corynebacterium sp. H130]|uniref:LGFP repeat-containing protein n=1 Tax=Corynebacterium sp. H130 TaxID=3133444 RepID=UPI0030B1F6DE